MQSILTPEVEIHVFSRFLENISGKSVGQSIFLNFGFNEMLLFDQQFRGRRHRPSLLIFELKWNSFEASSHGYFICKLNFGPKS